MGTRSPFGMSGWPLACNQHRSEHCAKLHLFSFPPTCGALLNSGSWPPLTGQCDHTHWIHHTQYDSSGWVFSPTERPLADNTQHLQHTHTEPCPQGDSNPRSQPSKQPQTHALDHGANGMGNAISSLLHVPSWHNA